MSIQRKKILCLDEEDGDLSVSGNESTNNSLEGDNSSDVEFPVSRKKDGNSSTCLVNSAQKGELSFRISFEVAIYF